MAYAFGDEIGQRVGRDDAIELGPSDEPAACNDGGGAARLANLYGGISVEQHQVRSLADRRAN
jgi:hypothetical protein